MDREFKVVISGDARSLVTESGKGAQALDTVNKKTGEHVENLKAASKESEHMEVSHRALRFGLEQISPEAAEAGHAILLSFANPATAGFLLVTLALGGLIKKWDEMKEKAAEADEVVRENTEAFSKCTEEAIKLGQEAAKAYKAFADEFTKLRDAQNGAGAQSDAAIAKIKAEEDAVRKLMATRKEYELSQATTDDQRKEIENRYKFEGQNVDVAEQRKIVAAKEKELDDAKTERSKAELALKQAEEKAGPGMATAREAVRLFQEGIPRLEKQAGEPFNAQNVAAVTKHDNAVLALQQSQALIAKYQAQIEEANAELAKARQAVIDKEKVVTGVQGEIPGLKAGLTGSEAQAFIDQSKIGAMVTAGAAALEALKEHGGRVAELSQSQVAAIKSLTTFLQGIGANNSTMLGLIEKANNDREALAQRIAQLEARMRGGDQRGGNLR